MFNFEIKDRKIKILLEFAPKKFFWFSQHLFAYFIRTYLIYYSQIHSILFAIFTNILFWNDPLSFVFIFWFDFFFVNFDIFFFPDDLPHKFISANPPTLTNYL